MNNILEEMFVGNIQPLEEDFENTLILNEMKKEMYRMEEEIKKGLTAELAETFDQFLNHNMTVHYENEKHFFIEGFQLGSRIMMEVLKSKEPAHESC